MFRTGWCAQWKRNKEKSSGEARLYPRKQKTQGAGRWDFIFTKYPLNQREHDLVKVVNWPDNGSPEKRLSTRGHRENGRIKRKKKEKERSKKEWKGPKEEAGTKRKLLFYSFSWESHAFVAIYKVFAKRSNQFPLFPFPPHMYTYIIITFLYVGKCECKWKVSVLPVAHRIKPMLSLQTLCK